MINVVTHTYDEKLDYIFWTNRHTLINNIRMSLNAVNNLFIPV